MSEKEMLLLSNYAYMDISTDSMSIGESINRFRNSSGGFDEVSVRGAGVGGGLTCEEAADLFTRIDNMPKDFKNLYPSKVLNDNDIRGICYTEGKSETGEGTLVFRGTGGSYEAWHDNVLGQCSADTAIQKKATDFVNNECGSYSSLNVCGHSKGGNLAMYVTVTSAAMVTSCVSFDGQGFSEDFIDTYRDRISDVSGRIKSINAHNDFVSILLKPIAGNTEYVENDGTGVNAHSSYHMLISNDYDQNGNIVSIRKQSVLSGALKELADGVSDRLSMLPGMGNRDITGLMAAMVAGIISSEKSENYEYTRLLSSVYDVGDYFMSATPEYSYPISAAVRLSALSNEALYDGMNEKSERISEVATEMNAVRAELDGITEDLDYSNKIDCYLGTKLGQIREKLYSDALKVNLYSEALRRIGVLYSKSETQIGERMLGEGLKTEEIFV